MFLSTTVMNKGIYEGLPTDYQAIVDEVFDEANEYDDFVHKNELNKIISSKSAEQLEKDYHHYVVNGGPRSMSSRRLKMVQAALKAVNETA